MTNAPTRDRSSRIITGSSWSVRSNRPWSWR